MLKIFPQLPFFFLSCCSQVGTLIWKGLQVGGQRDGKNPAAVCYLILISQSQLLAQTLRPQKINNFITARVHTHTRSHTKENSLHVRVVHEQCQLQMDDCIFISHTNIATITLGWKYWNYKEGGVLLLCTLKRHHVLFCFFKYIFLRDKSRIIFWNIPKARPPSFCQ